MFLEAMAAGKAIVAGREQRRLSILPVPLQLRVETQLGFAMVKYIRVIEFIENDKTIGLGQGGWREDYQHFQPGGRDMIRPLLTISRPLLARASHARLKAVNCLYR